MVWHDAPVSVAYRDYRSDSWGPLENVSADCDNSLEPEVVWSFLACEQGAQ